MVQMIIKDNDPVAFLLALMEIGGVALVVVHQDSSAAMTREMSEALQALAESETRCPKRFEAMIPGRDTNCNHL